MFQALICFCFSNAQLKHTLFIDASAMPTVPESTLQSPAEPHKDTVMNSKLLFVATLMVALIGGVAMAQASPPQLAAAITLPAELTPTPMPSDS